jgi:hypothetical protein
MPTPRHVDNPLDTKQTQLHDQLLKDVYEVFVVKTKSLDSFPPEYQERLRNTYRFGGYQYESGEKFIPPVDRRTQDLV